MGREAQVKKLGGIIRWRSRRLFIALAPSLMFGCATTSEVSQLTTEALERAKLLCHAPNVRLSTNHHVSIVVSGPLPLDDRRRQTDCLGDQLRARYWWDQIVFENGRPSPL